MLETMSDQSQLQNAINIFKNGGVVVFPTDTVYGIGCRMDNAESVKRVFSIRNRSEEKAVLLLVSSVAMAAEYVLAIPKEVKEKLIDIYWPGSVTIIFPANKEKVPDIVRAGGDTVAIRQTNHPMLLEILQAIDVPIIAPSANFSGEKTPVTFEDINPRLIENADYVLKGQTGGSVASTIIDCSVSPWQIVREGAVKIAI